MAEIVNLRRARKIAARTAREAEAQNNRAKFGVPAPLRTAIAHDRTTRERTLDGAKRERPQDGADPA